jgi:hypothetical protein
VLTRLLGPADRGALAGPPSQGSLRQLPSTLSQAQEEITSPVDHKNVTFVSVTQSFNTTTSMGRLTLNILLSFAQFKRAVIGERIRDKFAASRKKGMWMGGFVPLGYDVKDRKPVLNEREAATVRMIFERYTRMESATALAHALRTEGITGKQGKLVNKGYLYKVLNNRVYVGEAVHSRAMRLADLSPIVLARLVAHRRPCSLSIKDLIAAAERPWCEQEALVFEN